MAKIAREGCELYEKAVFLLFVYFVEARQRAMKQRSQSQSEEEFVNTLQ